jgi:glycosyltransferase involved in cell wall biosynthesis
MVKKIKSPHFNWILGQDAKTNNRYVNRIKAPAHELVAISDFIQKEFKRNYGITPQHVIAPGIDKLQLPFQNVKKTIDILGVGSLIPLKQFDVFIETIVLLKKDFPSIRARLIGEGPEKSKLEALIKTYQLEDNVLLTGSLPYEKVLEQLVQE